ncbi:CocE/NonD family hydrolase [soil metagenome]
MPPRPLLPTLALLLAASHLFAQAEGDETKAIGRPTDPAVVLQKVFPPGTTHETLMVPMRDGTKLATDTFIPPGPGPWPVLFTRGYYGRLAGSVYADKMKAKDGQFAFVCQDARGRYGSEGKDTAHITSPDYEIDDCADTLKWIAAQKWCNGRIGYMGSSGNGVGGLVSYLVKDPHLVVSRPSISVAYPYYYWGFSNGVARWLYFNWFGNTGLKVEKWPKPTIATFDVPRWKEILATAAKDNPTDISLSTGWYDLGSEAVLDYFEAFAPTGKITAMIRPYAHKAAPEFTWPQKPFPFYVATAAQALLKPDLKPVKSQLAYYLMGNFRNPEGPGNYYKTTTVWPVPNTPTPYYFHADGSLSTELPTAPEASQTFPYDPKDPAPSLGGNATYDKNAGPFDQLPLKDRKDILRYISAPLETPLEITGKLLADLYFSTDVPDTEFVIKVVDIHPDGYEMLIRESAGMARYSEDFHGKPAPLEKGHVYHLKMDLWSTAIVLDKGHRLAVFVTSSSATAYEVHPNSFDPVMSYDASPIAHQVIYLSKESPSHIIVPVVPYSP